MNSSNFVTFATVVVPVLDYGNKEPVFFHRMYPSFTPEPAVAQMIGTVSGSV